MLVFNRKKDEAIILKIPGFPPVRILAVDCRRSYSRIGIDAPASIIVDREEVHQRKAVEGTRRGGHV